MQKINIQLPQPLADLLTDYLFSRESENLRHATLDNYRFIITAFMQFLHDNGIGQIEEVTPLLIRKYKKQLLDEGKRDSTIDAHHRALATFFKWLHFEDFIEKNPFDKVKKSKVDVKAKQPFSPDDISKLLSACQSVLEEAMLYLFLDCGLRVSEAVSLRLENVDLERGIILLENTKGRVDRSLGMSSRTRLLLRKMLSKRRRTGDDFLFVNRSGKPFTRSGLSQIFVKLKKRAGVVTEGRLHGMRRTCITTLAKNGIDLPTIQRISGHKNPRTLIDRYVSIDDEHMIRSVKTKGAVQTLLR